MWGPPAVNSTKTRIRKYRARGILAKRAEDRDEKK